MSSELLVEPTERAPRRWPGRVAGVALGVLAAYAIWALLIGMHLVPAFPWSKTVATWTLARGATIDPAATRVPILVSRIECNSGQTGELREPRVVEESSRVLITAYVAVDNRSGADCQGNPGVSTEVRLDAPVGHRTLVDAAFLGDPPAAPQGACADGGIRWPRSG